MNDLNLVEEDRKFIELMLSIKIDKINFYQYFKTALFLYGWDVKNNKWKDGALPPENISMETIINIVNNAMLLYGTNYLIELYCSLPADVVAKGNKLLHKAFKEN